MSRKGRAPKRQISPDPKYKSVVIEKFVNAIMERGKKTVARRIVYMAFDFIKEKSKQDPRIIFEKAIKNVSPVLEVKSKRIGGANYQVPMEVRGDRRQTLAFRWIIGSSVGKKGKPMYVRLANELMDAAKKDGGAMKKRSDVHRMAEANKAFAHFA